MEVPPKKAPDFLRSKKRKKPNRKAVKKKPQKTPCEAERKKKRKSPKKIAVLRLKKWFIKQKQTVLQSKKAQLPTATKKKKSPKNRVIKSKNTKKIRHKKTPKPKPKTPKNAHLETA
jgi:hypothetical protein